MAFGEENCKVSYQNKDKKEKFHLRTLDKYCLLSAVNSKD